jgi:hypothetical protein
MFAKECYDALTLVFILLIFIYNYPLEPSIYIFYRFSMY